MRKNIGPGDDRPQDGRLGRMVLLSGFLHFGFLGAMFSYSQPSRSAALVPNTYTVSLVTPAVLTPSRPHSAPPKVTAPTPQKPPSESKPRPERSETRTPKTRKPEIKQPRVKATKKKPEQTTDTPTSTPKKTLKTAQKKESKPGIKKLTVRRPTKVEVAAKKPGPKKISPKRPAVEPPQEERAVTLAREQKILAALEKVRKRVGSAPRREVLPTLGAAAGRRAVGETTLRGLPFLLYTNQVKQHVKNSWIVAEHRPGLSAVVRFGILASGDIVAIELARRSGDRLFDDSVLRAVKKANPLPPPPEAYRDEFILDKVEVVFGETRHVQ